MGFEHFTALQMVDGMPQFGAILDSILVLQLILQLSLHCFLILPYFAFSFFLTILKRISL